MDDPLLSPSGGSKGAISQAWTRLSQASIK